MGSEFGEEGGELAEGGSAGSERAAVDDDEEEGFAVGGEGGCGAWGAGVGVFVGEGWFSVFDEDSVSGDGLDGAVGDVAGADDGDGLVGCDDDHSDGG